MTQSECLHNITDKPSWIGASKPSYIFDEILSRPTTLSGYGITDAVNLTNFNSHINNENVNQKHLTDTQLVYFMNLISWWKLDQSGNLYTDLNLYSTQGVSAYGVGDGGGGESGSLAGLTDVQLTDLQSGQILQYNGSHWINANSGGVTASWGPTTDNFSTLTVESISKTVALQGHTHSADQITGLSGLYVPVSRSITAGAGLTGGGDLTANRSIDLDIAYVQGLNVASASALQTPRMINDTMFDGTQNIVTSIWGASRTFTIAGAPMSVDGSGDVVWSGLMMDVAWSHGSESANKLAYQRTIALSGSVTGQPTGFDGTQNINIPVTGLNAGYLYNTIPDSVLGNSSLWIGTTQISLNRKSGDMPLSGITTLTLSDTLYANAASFTSLVASPIFNLANGWTIEASGEEMVFKQNNELRGKLTSEGLLLTGGVSSYI